VLVSMNQSPAYNGNTALATRPLPPVPVDRKKRPKRVKKVGLSYAPPQTGIGGATRTYEAPLFDLNEVRVACEIDSFVRRAINRHVDAFMKQGYAIKGNPKTVKYLRKRFQTMAMMTGKPFRTFLGEAAADFVKYHNVFLAKGRLDPNTRIPGMPKLKGITDKQPISAFFKLAPPTISVARKRVGNETLMWMQTVGEPVPKLTAIGKGSFQKTLNKEPNRILFKPANMVHFYKDREEGEIYGTPFVLPCIPDVKTLREVEQYAVELVHLFSNPIVEWRVGTEERPGEKEDIEDARSEAELGPVSGIYVIPGDQKIEVHAASAGTDVIKFLEYFEKRVFTGLGTSQTQMGRGDTSNRSTARSMEDEFMDRIRGYHAEFAAFFNELIVNELLMEAGIDPMDETVTAWIEFHDPDVNRQILIENQEIQKFTNYMITRTEGRRNMGYDPLEDADRHDTYMGLIKMPLAIIQAVDEPFTPEAKDALKKSTGIGSFTTNPPDNSTSKPSGGSSDTKTKTPDNKTRPKNQHGTGTRRPAGSREDTGREYYSQSDMLQTIGSLVRMRGGRFADMTDEEIIDALERGDKELAEVLLEIYRKNTGTATPVERIHSGFIASICASFRERQGVFQEMSDEDIAREIALGNRHIAHIVREMYFGVDMEEGFESLGEVPTIVERISKSAFAEFYSEASKPYQLLHKDMVSLVYNRFDKDTEHFNIGHAESLFREFEDSMEKVEESRLWPQFLRGVKECMRDTRRSVVDMERIEGRFAALLEDYKEEWKTYTKIVYDRLVKNLADAADRQEAVSLTQGVFEALDYLHKAKAKTHFYHSRNFGYGFTAYLQGEDAVIIKHFSNCEKCGKIDRIELDGFGLHKLPPFHYNCECEAKVE